MSRYSSAPAVGRLDISRGCTPHPARISPPWLRRAGPQREEGALLDRPELDDADAVERAGERQRDCLGGRRDREPEVGAGELLGERAVGYPGARRVVRPGSVGDGGEARLEPLMRPQELVGDDRREEEDRR